MPLKLGKKPPRHDVRTLKLRKYLRAAQIPTLPPRTSWSQSVLDTGGYPMFRNDELGDCAIAGPAHMIQTWTANTGSLIVPTDADVLAAYSAVGGYNPSDPSTDNGCVLLDVLNYWRKSGIAGQKISAFVALDPQDPRELMYAIWLFGGVLLGAALPDSVVNVDDLVAAPWDDHVADSANPANGHCIVASDYDMCAGLTVETWGTAKPMSFSFARRYLDEAYAILSPDWLGPNGRCPAGFDGSMLAQDLQELTSL